MRSGQATGGHLRAGVQLSRLTLNNCCNVCHDQQVEDWAINQVVYQHLYRKVTHSECLSSLCISTVHILQVYKRLGCSLAYLLYDTGCILLSLEQLVCELLPIVVARAAPYEAE